MSKEQHGMSRRSFLTTAGLVTAGSLLSSPASALINSGKPLKKKRVVLAGTGIRGTGMWGKNLADNYSDYLEFVALFDINPGRLEYAKQYMGVKCKTFTDFDKMVKESKPDTLIVTTVDSTHHEYIIRGLEYGLDVITEKPMTTDETKCQAILDAEKKSGKKVKVTFNYRYSPLFTKLKQLMVDERIGKLISVDFHWYLNTYHGASYFRRWHGERDKGGTLLVHKATHHFDLLNWFIDSEPYEAFAYGDLEHYGKNNAFRGEKCRGCQHKEKCGGFYWDITQSEHLMNLYVKNEKHDGYIRDNCLWRKEIDIYDKMAVQMRYANNVQVSYSLTTYSPYEGWRIGFNGTKGRIDAWEGIPWQHGVDNIDQAKLHAAEMDQNKDNMVRLPVMIMDNFKDYTVELVEFERGGHGGGDKRLLTQTFIDPDMADPLKHAAGTRDGSMSVLAGVAARKSIETGKPVKIGDLTSLKPQAKRP